MRSVYFYDMQGNMVYDFINGEEVKLSRQALLPSNRGIEIVHETVTLQMKEYVKEGRSWCIAGVDERDILSVLNNMVFDVHVSQDIYDREFYERQIDIEAMMRDKLFRKLSEKLKDRVTFTTRPSYTPNYNTITASI